MSAGSIGIVAHELGGAARAGERPIGQKSGDTDTWRLARRLAAGGWRVQVLYCGSVEDAGGLSDVRRRLAAENIGFVGLCRFGVPEAYEVVGRSEPSWLSRGERVRHALEALHREHHFDFIEFPERHATGFRAIQAKRAGLQFEDVRLIVKLHGSSQWLREANLRWMKGVDDLQLDYCERYAFENADVQMSSGLSMLDYARGVGWDVRADARVSPLDLGVEGYAEMREERGGRRCAAPAAATDTPLVTACVPFYNLGAYLPEALASLAGQTYRNLEVLVIDDGSSDPASVRVFEEQERRYPRFRFLRQANGGLGATRNRGIEEAGGEYFVPLDADNVADPHLVERLVAGIHRRPEISALTCYFLAFREASELARGQFRYAYRPVGGPRTMGSLMNVYGDATAIYRLRDLRAVGGYETDPTTGFEDWEAFVKLTNAGHVVDVLPDHLLYYRRRADSLLRTTSEYRNRRRVLRQYFRLESLPAAERVALWTAFVSLYLRLEHQSEHGHDPSVLRYRIADQLNTSLERHPTLYRCLRRLAVHGWRMWQRAPARRRQNRG